MTKIVRIQDHERFGAAGAPSRPKGERVERRFVQIDTEILEKATKSPLTSRESRVFLAVVKATCGWHRSTARLSQDALAKMTGMTPKRCSEALNGLLRKRVLIREGGGRSPVGINTRIDDWNFEPQQARVTPKRQHSPKQGHRPQDGDAQRPQDGDTYKDRKDTSPYGEESTAGADDAPHVEQDLLGEPSKPEPAKATRTGLPPCPHQAILDLWAEIMPDKRPPMRGMWPASASARSLAARWKQGFGIAKDHTGKPLYQDVETGIDWWGRFFRYMRKECEFLMRDESRFFDLHWVVKRSNFEKILSGKYSGGDA